MSIQDERSYKLINEEELKRFRLDNPKMDDLEVMSTLTIQLTQQLRQMEKQRCLTMAKGVEPLKCFTSLRPSEEEIRRALIKLINMPHPEDSNRKLIYCKSHWLAVMRALQFLGVVSTNYGCRQEFVEYLNRILPDFDLGIDAGNLKAIESENPFKRQLPDWFYHLCTQRIKYYWRIAILFLETL